jgi:uncharacterized protein
MKQDDAKNSSFVKMTLKGLMVDPSSKMPIVVLRDESSGRVLPIWIGIFEANAIAVELEHIKTPRPMTHDLLRSVLEQLGAHVTRVDITHVVDSTYFALITLSVDGRAMTVDARPSDAIALAIRAQAPIFAEEDVLERSKSVSLSDGDEERQERVKKWLEGIDPNELGRYKM